MYAVKTVTTDVESQFQEESALISRVEVYHRDEIGYLLPSQLCGNVCDLRPGPAATKSRTDSLPRESRKQLQLSEDLVLIAS